jgi:hypothetical protein
MTLVQVAALITAAVGLVGVVRPKSLAALADWPAEGGRARAEGRVSLGALWLGLGGGVLWFPAGAPVLAAAFGAMAVVRLLTMVVDGDRSPRNLALWASEVVLAAMLLM